MPLATDAQVQHYADQRMRVRPKTIRALINSLADDLAAIDDVYAACVQDVPTWTDARTDGPPKLLGPQDVLAYNAYCSLLNKVFAGTATAKDITDLHANQAVVISMCPDPVSA